MKKGILVVVVFLAGCNVVSSLPSMQHCSEVMYTRTGQNISIQAKCTAPVGENGL